MRLFLLLLFAFSQAFFPFSLADRLSGELFRAVFHNNQNGEFQKTDANSALQKAMQQNPELAQNSLSFVPGENCHSIMMEDSGKFSLSMNVSNTNSNIWCNWIIWAGPGRRILVNITGFKSNEDCAKNQDVIIFHAIASTAESTVIYACWNKSIHSFSARALALNVVYMSGRSSQMDESGYFNGTYSLYEDYERSNLKYPLLSSPVAKEKGWHHNSGENKTSSGRLLVSTIAATSVPMKGRYTGNINPTSHMASSLSFPTTSWKKTTYRREQFLSPLRPTKNSKGARSSTDGAVTSRKGDQILMAVPTKRTTAKDGGVNMQGITESSSVPKTMWHFMTTKHQAKSLITLNAHTSSEENGGYVTSTNIPPFPNVKQTIPAKKIYQLYNSSSPVSENSYIEAEIIEQGSGIIKNDSYEKGLRFTTESNNLNQVTNISKSKQTFSMEKPVGKDGALTSSQMQDALSRTVTMHVGVSVAPKKVHQSAFRGYSITARSIPRGNPLVSTSQAPYSEMVITTKTVQQTPFKDQQISSDSKTIQYSKSFQEELNMFSLEYKYGPSAYTYDNGASPEKDPITKSAFFIKARKNKKKRPFFKPRRKNRRKNLEMGDKNNSEPIFLEFSKSNPAATPPVRVVKALKTDTSVAAENIDPQSRDSKSPPPIHESTLQLSGFPSASGLLIEKHIATLGSPNITTLEGRQQEDPFGAVAVAVSNNSGLQNQHKPGDSLFTLILVIDYQDILPEKGQNMDLLQSIMETIKEHILDPSSQLNEIKLQHFQRTTKIRAVLSFWIHLKHGGKDLHTFKSQLKKFESTSLGNGKYVPVSFSIEDINECESGLESCDENAECHNEIGAYTCLCRDGYEDHSADALGTECVLSQPSGIGPFFSYVEILLGSLLGVILLLVLAVVVSCVLVRKRQVERTIDLSVAKDLAAQPDRPRPSFVHMSMESENVTHRVFPVVKLTTAEGQATSKRLSDVTTVTLEKSACL